MLGAGQFLQTSSLAEEGKEELCEEGGETSLEGDKVGVA